MQDATTVTRTQLLLPWRQLILHVPADPDVVLDRLRARLVKPALWRMRWPSSAPEGTVRGNQFELFAESFRTRVVLEGQVVGASNAAIIRILVRPRKVVLIFGGIWLAFATLFCSALAASALVYRDPLRLAALLFPLVGYAFMFGGFPALALGTLDWLSRGGLGIG